MIYLTLFIIGVFELFLNIIDFKLTQKNRKILSSFSTLIHIYIWYFIGRSLFTNIDAGIMYVTSYAIGCAFGCYLGMTCEPFLDTYIIRLKNRKGRKVRRGKTINKRKK